MKMLVKLIGIVCIEKDEEKSLRKKEKVQLILDLDNTLIVSTCYEPSSGSYFSVKSPS